MKLPKIKWKKKKEELPAQAYEKTEENIIPEYQMSDYDKENYMVGFEGAVDLLSTMIEPKHYENYLIHYTSQNKFEIAESLKANGKEKLAKLTELGADFAPVFYLIKSKAPGCFKASNTQKEILVKGLGYNGNLNDAETELMAKRIAGMPIFTKYAPFNNADQIPWEQLMAMGLKKEGMFNPLGFEGRKNLEQKLGGVDPMAQRNMTENWYDRPQNQYRVEVPA